MNNKKITSLRDLYTKLDEIESGNWGAKKSVIENFSLPKSKDQIRKTDLTITEINLLLEELMIDKTLAEQIIDNLGIEFHFQKIKESNNPNEIGIYLDKIDLISQEISEKLLEKISVKELATIISDSNDSNGIKLLLEIVTIISLEKGKELLDVIPDKKIIALVKEAEYRYPYDILRVITNISKTRAENIIEKMHDFFYQRLENTTVINDFYYDLWALETYSNEETTKIILKFPLQKIVDLVTFRNAIEFGAGIVEVMGKLSNERAIDFLNEIEPIVIKRAQQALEAGDITDFLEVLPDISMERAKTLLDKISIQTIANRILETEIQNSLRGIAWILKRVNAISKEDAINLLKIIDIKILKEKVQNIWKNYPSALNLIKAVYEISHDDAEFLVADLEINFLKNLMRGFKEIAWFLELIYTHSKEKAKLLVDGNDGLLEVFERAFIDETIRFVLILTKIIDDPEKNFFNKITKDDIRSKIDYEITEAIIYETKFNEKGKLERTITEIKKLADIFKIISEEKEKEVLFLLDKIIQEKISSGDITTIDL